MEKEIRGLLMGLSLMVCGVAMAQTENIIRPGLVRAQLTISPAHMFSDNHSYFYLHGNAEGYLSPHVSVAGEGYYYVGVMSAKISPFDFNHSLFFGTSWHFTKKNNDFYIGFQPGLSITRVNPTYYSLGTATTGVNPLFSPVVGYNVFVGKVFHFFLQGRMVFGKHHYDVPKNMNEARVSAGLGFNVNTLK